MAVDIFYKELSYEEIEQNVALSSSVYSVKLEDFWDCYWERLFSLSVNSSISSPWQLSTSSRRSRTL